MTRKKVKLAYITDVTARKATFKKRKNNVLKKVNELTILCGIQACAIISNPFDSTTEVWPNEEEAKQVMEKYQNAYVIDANKNVTQESFIMQRIIKVQDQVKKQRQENREKEMTLCMLQFMQNKGMPPNLTNADLKDLEKLIEKNLKEVEKNMNTIKENMIGSN